MGSAGAGALAVSAGSLCCRLFAAFLPLHPHTLAHTPPSAGASCGSAVLWLAEIAPIAVLCPIYRSRVLSFPGPQIVLLVSE